MMTDSQQIATILLMAACVMLTRALAFVLFPSKDRTPRFVRFLGKYLASAVFGMLIIYCLKDTSLTSGTRCIAQLLGILFCVILHLRFRNMLLTIAGGTIFYMILIQNI